MDNKDNQDTQPGFSGAGEAPNKDNKVSIDINTGAMQNIDSEPANDSDINTPADPQTVITNNQNVASDVNDQDATVAEPKTDDSTPVEPLAGDTSEKPTDEDISTTNLTPSVQPKVSQVVENPSELVQLKKRNKFLKAWVVVFLVILVALISAGLVYFNLYNKNQASNNDLKAQNSQLQQKLIEQNNNANQQTINQLNQKINDQDSEIADLNKKIETQEALIADYKKTVDALLKACGAQCSDIVNPSQSIIE